MNEPCLWVLDPGSEFGWRELLLNIVAAKGIDPELLELLARELSRNAAQDRQIEREHTAPRQHLLGRG